MSIDTAPVPETLAYHADMADEDPTEWTALVSDGDASRIYRWKLDPDTPFGRANLEHWLARIVQRHGYPVRVQWRRMDAAGRGGSLIVDHPLWGTEDSTDEGGFAAAMVPGNFSGAEIEHEAATPFERLVKLIVEQPEVAANAFRTIIEPFFRSRDQRDAELIRLAAEHSAQAAASAAAAAVEQKLAQMAIEAGYDVDEEGIIMGEEESFYPDNMHGADADWYDDEIPFQDLEADEAAPPSYDEVEVAPVNVATLASYSADNNESDEHVAVTVGAR